MEKNKIHLANLVAIGPNSLTLNVWTQYPPLHIYYTPSVECFSYLTFCTAVACDQTPRTFHLCCFLTNCTLNNFLSQRCHLDRNTK